MKVKIKEKRVLKGYKIAQKDYDRAMRKAKKDDFPLASLIEEWVIDYGKYGSIIKDVNNEEFGQINK